MYVQMSVTTATINNIDYSDIYVESDESIRRAEVQGTDIVIKVLCFDRGHADFVECVAVCAAEGTVWVDVVTYENAVA